MITEEQRKNRKKGIGGSDVAAICGMSPWKTAYDVWLDKTGQLTDDVSNNAMVRGNHSESIIRNWYEENYHAVETPSKTFYHPKYDFLMAHIDGINREKDIILECKSTRSNKGWGMEGSAEIPDHYLFQIAHYAMVMGVSQVDIAVFFTLSDKFSIYRYKRHKDLEKAILDTCTKFWNQNVLKNNPPEIKTLDSARKAFEEEQEKSAYASDEICRKVEVLKKIQKRQKELKEKEESLKTDIMIEMREASKLVDSQERVLATWKNVVSNRFDSTKFKKDNPETASQYMKESKSRKFLIK